MSCTCFYRCFSALKKAEKARKATKAKRTSGKVRKRFSAKLPPFCRRRGERGASVTRPLGLGERQRADLFSTRCRVMLPTNKNGAKKVTENERLKRIESKLDTLSELLRPTERTTPDDCPCLSSWLHTWLDEFKAPFVSRKWLGILRSGVDNYILPNISDRPLYSVTVADMRRAVNSVPYSSMRQVVYSIFCAAFRTAHNLGYIMTDSAALLNKVTHRRQKGKALSLDVQYSFLASISGNPMRPLYLFYLLSGCRRSEALALRWTDVDTRSGRIRIRGTKTANSDR